MRGDIMKVETTGASERTARQDKLTEKGVAASHKMAHTDSTRMKKYKSIIEKVAKERNASPAVIAGIISRESRAGAALKDGWGDHGNGFGLMQVDKRYHAIKGEWDSKEHISQGTEILLESIGQIEKKFPDWTAEQQLKGGIAAYNCGPGGVKKYESVDSSTTGQDYSNDTTARAQWYQKNW
ncbi:lysozyme g-like [Ambystoma mexicanum]|uniref:lysozyme g-like n=1 Tax=Ambystoma mexicanum TaxID=8296 RepID=UPI0037E850B7